MFLIAARQTPRTQSVALLLIFLTFGAPAIARSRPPQGEGLDLVCPLVLHERQRELGDVLIEKDLAENEYRARVRVFGMIEQLWSARSIEQEAYLDYRRLRDRTKVRIARLATQLAQQRSIVEQYALTCAHVGGDAVDRLSERVAELQAEYRRLDCELLARDAEIADIDYAFDRAILEATRALVERNVKSKYELVIDEYDLSQSEARSQTYWRRTRECRKRLEKEGAE